MIIVLIGLLGCQAIAMLFDEFYFHHRRGLPRWEKIGHPVDTLSVLFCWGYLLLNPYSASNLVVFIGLASFSCLLITKDEWVHALKCSGGEHWLHSILFILHPMAFGLAGWIWSKNSESVESFLVTLKVQVALVTVFISYQIFYWNFYATKKTH